MQPNIKKIISLITLSICSVHAAPQNPQVVAGKATFEGLKSSSLVIETGKKAIINWDSFSISSKEMVRFIQGGADAAVLNRVLGKEISKLQGLLQSNGKVYLLNPNGVLISKDAIIDVGSFIASTLDISNQDFLDGKELLFDGDSLEPVTNKGNITAQTGDIILLAHKVENKGSLTAEEGGVHLGAGHRILVGVKGKNLYVHPELPGDGIKNEGKIKALRASLTANSNPYSLGIQNEGTIDALHIEESEGEIYLSCKGSSFRNKGKFTAEGNLYINTEDADIENQNSIIANGDLQITSHGNSLFLSEQKPVSNYGTLQANKIQIDSPKWENDGTLSANQEISIFAPGAYVETEKGKLQVENGVISIFSGSFFSSGEFFAAGEVGGTINIEAEQFVSTAATFNASSGGKIRFVSTSPTQSLYLNEHVILDADNVELLSALPINSKAHINGDLFVPSKIIAQKTPTLIDPTPNEENDLWVAYAADKVFKDSFWQIWDRNTIFELNDPSIDLAQCPPTGIELVDPNASGTSSTFGDTMAILLSGKVVVTKAGDNFGAPGAGAVYLYNGFTGALVSTLRGSFNSDQIGSEGVTVLTPNDNYVISSSHWNGNRGAATLGKSQTGVSGTVSSSNSLVGPQPNDLVANNGAVGLTNGNYVVRSTLWENGGAANAGAVTLGNGTSGTTGTVTSSNSLVGTSTNDQIGSKEVVALNTGNYVVVSPGWDDGGTTNVGAVTFGDGDSGVTGTVTSSNSLVGSTANDSIGSEGVTALFQGNYVVSSPLWDNGGMLEAGAATFGSGSSGITGTVTSSNSLVGTTSGDRVSDDGIVALLLNGNYLVHSSMWNDPSGPTSDVGAVTFGNGTTGITGTITSSNSLIGTTATDLVGSSPSTALPNGNYVVRSPSWDNGAIDNAGAATWGNGTTGITGTVSTSNSIVGTQIIDGVATDVVALTNGNFVVVSTNWANGAITGAGAITFGDGSSGTTGTVSSSNSLIGTNLSDNIGSGGVTALTNGNYVVISPNWGSGPADVGAVTFGDGNSGVSGTVSSSNSLIGINLNDKIGSGGVVALSNNNYVVLSPNWDDNGTADVGAVTFGDGNSGITGPVSISNSLVGSTASDNVGNNGIVEKNSDEFIFATPNWDNGGQTNAGAVTVGNSNTGTFCTGSFGALSSSNSFVGANANAGLNGSLTGSSTTGQVFAQFTSFSGETRVFAIAEAPTPTPTPTPTPVVASGQTVSQGITNFSVSVTQAFPLFNRLTMESYMRRYMRGSPSDHENALLLFPVSFITTEGPLPQIFYKGPGWYNFFRSPL